MGAFGRMGKRKSTCLYLDPEVVEAARRMGLSVSRVSENALVEAIGAAKRDGCACASKT